MCPTEITAFSDRVDEFKALGANVAAISVDSVYSHLKWAKTPRNENGVSPIKIPLISDVTKYCARNFGVLYYKEGIAMRATFIIDKNLIIKHISVNDLGVGRSVDETLRILNALIHVAKHGEVCPANWNAGDPALNVTQESVASYFSSKK